MMAGTTAHAASGEQITGVVNLANAGTAAPLPDGRNASVGSSNDYAREDHRHPVADGVMLVVSDNPLTSSDDLDTVTRVGFYRIGGTQPANCPSGVTWSVLMVSSVGTTRLQTIFNTDGTKFNIYQRNGGSSSWNSWKKIGLSDITALETAISDNTTSIEDLETTVSDHTDAIDSNETAINNKLIIVSGTISPSHLYIEDENISSEMCAISCEFGSALNVLSNYSIQTTAGKITFSNISIASGTTTSVTVILGKTKSGTNNRTFLRPVSKYGVVPTVVDTDHFSLGGPGEFYSLSVVGGMLYGAVTIKCSNAPSSLDNVLRFPFKVSATSWVSCYITAQWGRDVSSVKRAYFVNGSGDNDGYSFVNLNGATNITAGNYLTFIFAHSVNA